MLHQGLDRVLRSCLLSPAQDPIKPLGGLSLLELLEVEDA